MSAKDKTATAFQSDIQVGLPMKITGIVFWGLIAIGLVLVAEAMQWLHREMETNQNNTAKDAMQMVRAVFDRERTPSAAELQRQLDLIVQNTAVIGVRVDHGLDTAEAGEFAPTLTRFADNFSTGDDAPSPGEVHVSAWFRAVDEVLAPQKKRLMIEMGMLVFAFGTILQWILQNLLDRPITRMVAAARECSQGRPAHFNETRSDEFGYLARFINRALDSLTQRQAEAIAALERAHASELALSQEKERAEVTLQSIAEGVITTDRAARVQFMNPVAEALSGYTQAEGAGLPIETVMQLKDECSGLKQESSVLACLRTDSVARELKGRILVRRDGEEIAIEENAAPIRDHAGHTIGAVLVFEDVRQTRELTRKLSYQASHDTLTGLYNRCEFEMRLRAELEKSGDEEQAPTTLCYMDLDQFKLVNDTCGHIAGDELLRQLARCLQDELRDTDTLARLGGDEFGVLLKGCTLEDASQLASKLRDAVREHPFTWEGKTFQVGVSIGVVPLSADTRDVTEALSAADVACYAAKENGRDRVHVYEADDDALQRKRSDMQWVSRIRQALKEDRFKLYQQPIVAINPDAASGTFHHEVLLRMLDEQGELLAPGQFLSAAEQFGLMADIDQWVLSRALHWLSHCGARHACTHRLAINLSGQSLSSNAFLDSVIETIRRACVNPAQICFEVTETAAIADVENVARFMSALKAMGCEFALDDFGSGMSSFAYLKNLPVNYLKIDGSYVRDLVSDPVDRSLVEAVNQIGHAMGMQTIAEFVEDQATLGALAVIGVDYAQGYGIARPGPLEALSGAAVTALRKA